MSSFQRKPSFFAVLFFMVACLDVACLGLAPGVLRAEVFVDETPGENNRPAAVASDLEPVPAEEIAREVLRLQQQMGGSVVENRTELQGWDHAPRTPDLQEAPPWPTRPSRNDSIEANRPIHKVIELREAAWQLDTTAHRLENLDLYEQADALRDVASRLRRDARKMKQTVAGRVSDGVQGARGFRKKD